MKLYKLIAVGVALAAIGSCLLSAGAFAHPIEVYDGGTRLGVARPVVQCTGPQLRCGIGTGGQLTLYVDAGSGSGSSARSYLSALLPCTQSASAGISCDSTTGDAVSLGTNDHIAFRVVEASSGSDISLDTALAYSKQNNTASLGRFTLAAGTYRLRADVGHIDYSSNNGYIAFAWFNADTGAALGAGTVVVPTQFNAGNIYGAGSFETVQTFGSSTRVEVRIFSSGNVSNLLFGGTQADGGVVQHGPHAFIEKL